MALFMLKLSAGNLLKLAKLLFVEGQYVGVLKAPINYFLLHVPRFLAMEIEGFY
jgi:hypothetical protein